MPGFMPVDSAFKPCGTLQMLTAYAQNLQDLYINMFT